MAPSACLDERACVRACVSVGGRETIWTLERDGGRYLVALNFTGQPATLSIPGEPDGFLALSTYLDRAEPVSLDALQLRPDEGVIVEIRADK